MYFYKVFQGCFCFSWDMNLSILIGYLSVCTFKVNIYTNANCLKKYIMFSLTVTLGQMTQALLFSHEATWWQYKSKDGEHEVSVLSQPRNWEEKVFVKLGFDLCTSTVCLPRPFWYLLTYLGVILASTIFKAGTLWDLKLDHYPEQQALFLVHTISSLRLPCPAKQLETLTSPGRC